MRTIPVSMSGSSCIGGAHLQTHVLWSNLNRRLTQDVQRLPNEAQCKQWLDKIMGIEVADPRLFWLTLARLAEMVLKQAADYADHCEFQAAGDLLVNPRRIEIFVKGKTDPVIKKRHCGLREQFASVIGREEPAAWLSRKTLSHVCEKALIPYLKERLESSGWMHSDYLDLLERRMCRVADTIAFLSAWQITDCKDLAKRMVPAREDNTLIAANLCRFDLDCFNEMGDDIERIGCNANASSRFLNERDFSLSQQFPTS